MDSRLPLPLEGMALPDRTPVSRSAAENLRKLIEERGLKAGDQLPPQRELAERLSISRASLREALSVLETLGLVDVQPGRGVFVADRPMATQVWRFSDRGSPKDAYEVRYCVESFAAGIAAGRLSPDALATLRRSVELLEEAFERRDVEAMAAADSTFHDVIIEACGNPILTAMYRSVRELLVESQKLPMASAEGLDRTVAEHKALLAALETRDAAESSALMRHHIAAAAGRYGVGLSPDVT